MNQLDAARIVTDLFESWGPFLVRYVFRMTRSFELADDLVQEVFLALFCDLCGGKRIENTKAWTFGAIRNQLRKHARYIRRHAEELVPPETLDLMPARPCWPDVAADIDDCAPCGLELLSVREEEVLLLRLQSFKYRDISDELGISPKSVCTLLARALKKLRIARGSTRAGRLGKKQVNREVSDALQ